MDGQQFDQLARVFASGTTRRRVLGVFAGAIASLGLHLGLQSAVAGKCSSEGENCDGNFPPCCEGFTCVGAVCVAEPPCSEEGGICGQVAGTVEFVCCDGLFCIDGTCQIPEPVCSDEGGSCAGGRFPDCCNQGLECIDGTCAIPEPICAEIGESCGQLDGAIQVDCCDDLLCIDGLCEEPEPKCIVLGGECAETADCCEGECSDAGICEIIEDTCLDEGVACEADSECCEGICCAGFCRAIECCIDEPNPNDRCPEGTSCFEGICEGVAEFCEDDSTCGTGTCCCDDGSCSEGCCDPPVEDDDEPVTELPNTGVGGDATRSATWIGAAAIGATMAFLGGKKLKPQESNGASKPE